MYSEEEEEEEESVDSDSDEEIVSNFVIVQFPPEQPRVEEAAEQPSDRVTGQLYDEDLPLSHSYLGDLQRVVGRTILAENEVVTLPLLPDTPGAWVPGQTFPLTVHDRARCELLRKAVQGDRMFGCRARGYQRPNLSIRPVYGTTCEIYEFSDSHTFVTVKAKVRQRFKKLAVKRVEGRIEYADCQILPEISLRRPLTDFHLPSMNYVRRSIPKYCQLREAYCSPWPLWVHRQYDTDYLRHKVSTELLFLKQGLSKGKDRPPVPVDPTSLSFWLGTYLGANERQFLIQENSPIRRLRWMLSLTIQCQQYYCHMCDTQVGSQRDVFAMSAEGGQTTYVNPSGYVHDTITLLTASNVVVTSNPSTEFSWFPGYAWQIAVCWNCQSHVGWKFTNPLFIPSSFWGLSRQALHTKETWGAGGDENAVAVM